MTIERWVRITSAPHTRAWEQRNVTKPVPVKGEDKSIFCFWQGFFKVVFSVFLMAFIFLWHFESTLSTKLALQEIQI